MKPRIVVIDNYDSFTYNIVQAIGALGASVQTTRADSVSAEELAAAPPHGIIISPGPGQPQNAGASMQIVQRLSGSVPILGICLGHQVIAAAFGALVVRAAEVVHGKCSVIIHDGSRLFDRVPSPLRATRYHSLAVAENSLRSTPLRVCARSEEHAVMAIAHAAHDTFGVQFHPESIMSEHGQHIFSNFLVIAEEAA